MYDNHSKTWGGRSWHYLAIEFRCNGSENTAPHNIAIRARTLEEWAQHTKKLKFLVTPNAELNRPGSRSEAEAVGSELKPLLGEGDDR